MPAPFFVTDEHGGNEKRVEVGYGIVVKVEAGAKKTAVSIDDENPKLNTPVTGRAWNDSPQILAAAQSLEEGRRVAYRVETVRGDKIDPAIPFNDLGTRERFRELVHIEFAAPGAPEPAWFSKTASPQPRQPEAAVREAPEALVAPAASGDDGHDGHAAKPGPWRVRIVAPEEVEALLNKMDGAGFEPAHVIYAAAEKVLVAARRRS